MAHQDSQDSQDSQGILELAAHQDILVIVVTAVSQDIQVAAASADIQVAAASADIQAQVEQPAQPEQLIF